MVSSDDSEEMVSKKDIRTLSELALEAEARVQQLEEERNQLDAKYRQLSLAALQRQSVLKERIQQLEEALREIRVRVATSWILEAIDAALSPTKEED